MADVRIRVEAVSRDELTTQQQGQEVKSGISAEKLAVASIFAHQALSVGKQIVSTAISNIGNFTGDYVKQDRVQHAAEVVGTIASVGAAFAVNPIAGAVATIGLVTKEVLNVVTTNQQELHRERATALLRQRSGNTLTNGSRTGE